MTEGQSQIDQLCINTIRTLSMDAIQKANSGHPGAPMGLASAAYVLWTQILKHNPKNPAWIDRDRFVLSGGHASMLLYSLLHLTGYNVSLDDIKNFRQWQSKTPGHPEYGHTDGVETTTGPLGQGIANAVGMAMAEGHLAAIFNKPECEIINHHTYVMCGDGDLMEGVAHEAVSLAGHLGLAKLVCIYDDNKISIEGKTDITFTENVCKRFEAYNWHVIKVNDGNDIKSIYNALCEAKAEKEKPSLIAVRTHIAFGSPNKQDTSAAHGAPLGEEEVYLTKKHLGCDPDKKFFIPQEAMDKFRTCIQNGEQSEDNWQSLFNKYSKQEPKLTEQLVNMISEFLPEGWDSEIPHFSTDDDPIATRAASGKILNGIAQKVPALIGGSADLAPSNNTYINSDSDFQKDNYAGRNIRFGVREHAMGAILSGMFLHSGIKAYGGTFLVFADYMRPAIRVAALMKIPVIYVFTHDSIAVGEDGPTHQPVEHIAALRAIPNLTVIRPADAIETAQAWRRAIKTTNGPVALILSRQKLPILERVKSDGDIGQGAYIIDDCDGNPDIILIASGSEVSITVKAKKTLMEKGIKARVVSMPSWELFEQSPAFYKERVFPSEIEKRIAIEAGISMGWEKYVGNKGAIISMSGFGASAPGNVTMGKFGFTADNIVQKALEIINK